MANGTIVFVHGTGVRLRDYKESFSTASETAKACGINRTFIRCAWGDPFGVEFEGRSLPDAPTHKQIRRQEEELAQWVWLFADPLIELRMLTIRDHSQTSRKAQRGGGPWEWQVLWPKIRAYTQSDELNALLTGGGLTDLWEPCWKKIIDDPSSIPQEAFKASAHEL